MKKMVLILFLTGCAHVHPATYRGTCPTDFPIKGNADSFVYHTSGSPYYIHTIAEICFENEEAAERNGYRSIRQKNWKISVD